MVWSSRDHGWWLRERRYLTPIGWLHKNITLMTVGVQGDDILDRRERGGPRAARG